MLQLAESPKVGSKRDITGFHESDSNLVTDKMFLSRWAKKQRNEELNRSIALAKSNEVDKLLPLDIWHYIGSFCEPVLIDIGIDLKLVDETQLMIAELKKAKITELEFISGDESGIKFPSCRSKNFPKLGSVQYFPNLFNRVIVCFPETSHQINRPKHLRDDPLHYEQVVGIIASCSSSLQSLVLRDIETAFLLKAELAYLTSLPLLELVLDGIYVAGLEEEDEICIESPCLKRLVCRIEPVERTKRWPSICLTQCDNLTHLSTENPLKTGHGHHTPRLKYIETTFRCLGSLQKDCDLDVVEELSVCDFNKHSDAEVDFSCFSSLKYLKLSVQADARLILPSTIRSVEIRGDWGEEILASLPNSLESLRLRKTFSAIEEDLIEQVLSQMKNLEAAVVDNFPKVSTTLVSDYLSWMRGQRYQLKDR